MTTYSLDFSQTRLKSYAHQKYGTVKIFENKYFLLADEMGAGKTKQTIDAAQFLFSFGLIDRVVILCPASVRSVWFDPEWGELAKHLWLNQCGQVWEYHAKSRMWPYGKQENNRLQWIITNYDFIRSAKNRIEKLLGYCTERTLLVLDESSALKNYRAKQTQACKILRKACGRVILLNGTPIANNPGDLYSQADIMHPTILACKTWFHFRARYAKMGGWQGKQIVGWVMMDDLQKRLAPFVLRRLKADCLDLPEKLPPVTLTVPLTPKSWDLYKDMKDELVAWFDTQSVSLATQAITKVMRLSQITSGFLGGIEDQSQFDQDFVLEEGQPPPSFEPVTKAIGEEKLQIFLSWFSERLEEDPNLKLLVWCRFKPEAYRVLERLKQSEVTTLQTGIIIGGQKRQDREFALRLLDPRTMPIGPAVVVGTPSSGSMGLNLAGCHTVLYMSNDYSLKTRLQSEDRVHRPGQTHKVSYFDMVATGPNGQKTIDHDIIKVLRNKDEIATRTTSAWIQKLKEE